MNVAEGSYLLAVNGQPLRIPQDPYELFVNTAGQNVTLTVNSQPSDTGSRERRRANDRQRIPSCASWTGSSPIARKWMKPRAGKSATSTFPNMEDDGLNEFVRQFFPQIRKQALIIDVRFNGGGFVDQMIEAAAAHPRRAWSDARNWKPATLPDYVFTGPLACLTNEYSASDGDIFPYMFKFYKLGPTIGMRTWGGVRGIRGKIPLMDGGYITRPEFAIYGLDSHWVVENHGVEPDIVVDNLPEQVMAGHDPQLEKAIDYLMQNIPANPTGAAAASGGPAGLSSGAGPVDTTISSSFVSQTGVAIEALREARDASLPTRSSQYESWHCGIGSRRTAGRNLPTHVIAAPRSSDESSRLQIAPETRHSCKDCRV